MNDRELLEKAAKAAGYKLCCWPDENTLRAEVEPNWRPVWNPLKSDGDALRLAVKLGLLVDTHGMHVRVGFPYESPLTHETMGEARCAAVRSAIVHAAALLAEGSES